MHFAGKQQGPFVAAGLEPEEADSLVEAKPTDKSTGAVPAALIGGTVDTIVVAVPVAVWVVAVFMDPCVICPYFYKFLMFMNNYYLRTPTEQNCYSKSL